MCRALGQAIAVFVLAAVAAAHPGLSQTGRVIANTPQFPPGVTSAPIAPLPDLLRDTIPQDRPTLAPNLQAPPISPQALPNVIERFPVAGVAIAGNEAIADERLQPMIASLVRRRATPAEVEAARVALLTYYRRAGYPFISVTASPQAGPDGLRLVFVVQEGRIARVRLDGDIGPAGRQVLRFLRLAVSTGPTTRYRLERALLLAGDVPGVTVRGVLRPLDGGGPGELELVAEVTRSAFSGLVTSDNRAFRLTGPVQFLVIGQANSFTSLGERTEAAFFTSAAGETLFGQATTEFFIGSSGLRVRLYAGAGSTRPDGVLAAIGYAAFTRTAGAALSYPILRSRSANLTAGAQFDLYESTVDTGTNPAVRTSRDNVRAVRLGFDGQYLDSFLPFLPGAATTIANIRFHRGIAGLGATVPSRPPGPARQGSDFGFTKWTGEFQRTQPLFSPASGMLVSLQATVAGQWTNDVLPASEKYFLGGNRLGRGFYIGEVSGDSAVAFSGEIQLDVGLPSVQLTPQGSSPIEIRTGAQFYGFYDAGRTYENLPTDPNRRIESWGGGVRLNINGKLFVDLEGVRRLTRRVDAGGDAVRPLPATAGYFRVMTRF